MNAIRFLGCFALLAIVASISRADEAALRQAVTNYVEAFNAKDVKTLEGMWTEKATHTDHETGARTEGRDKILTDIKAALEDNPHARLAGHVDHVRMIRPDVAQIKGQTSVGAPDEEPEVTTFSAILVNEKGKWLIDSIDETSLPQPATAEDALKELEFLIGHWVDEAAEARVDTTIRWAPSRAFLIRSFVAQPAEGQPQQGTQIIGWDPRSQEIRSWTFNSDGSFGDGVWTKSGQDWLIKSSQTLSDGRAASGTYVLSRAGSDTLSLRLIGHEVEGEPQPASAAVKMARVADEAKPAASTTSQK